MPTHLYFSCLSHTVPAQSAEPVGLMADLDIVAAALSYGRQTTLDDIPAAARNPALRASIEFLQLHQYCSITIVDDEGADYHEELAKHWPAPAGSTVVYPLVLSETRDDARLAWLHAPNTYRLTDTALIVLDFAGTNVIGTEALLELIELTNIANTNRTLMVVDPQPIHPVRRPAAELRELLARQGVALDRLVVH